MEGLQSVYALPFPFTSIGTPTDFVEYLCHSLLQKDHLLTDEGFIVPELRLRVKSIVVINISSQAISPTFLRFDESKSSE